MDKEYNEFISNSRKDSGLVLEIAEKLTESGYNVWIVQDGIESGDVFKSVIVVCCFKCGKLDRYMESYI